MTERPDWLPEKYNSPEEFRKGFDELSSAFGRRSPLPAPDADTEAWDKALGELVAKGPEDWRDGLATPKEAEGYGLKAPEGLESAFEGVLDDFVALGMTKAQAQKAWEQQTERAKAAANAASEAKAGKIKALEDAFGAGLEKTKAEALAALDAYGSDEVRELLGEIGENPVMLGFLAKIGQTLGEDRVQYLESTRYGLTNAEVEDKIAEIREGITELEHKAFTGNLTDLEEKKLHREKSKLMELKRKLPGMTEEQGVFSVSIK